MDKFEVVIDLEKLHFLLVSNGCFKFPSYLRISWSMLKFKA